MQCPSCKKSELKPGKLERGLASMHCASCHGDLLSLVGYRLWAEQHEAELEEQTIDSAAVGEDTKHAIVCAKCSRVMLKFKYTRDRTHGVDVCTYCEDVWLDDGEWEQLRCLRLAGNIPKIFTRPWQNELRSARSSQFLETRWRERLGEDFARVEEIHNWLWDHPNRRGLLDFLTEKDPFKV